MTDIATSWNAAQSVGDWTLAPPSLELLVDEHGNSIFDQRGTPLSPRDPAFLPGDGLEADEDLYTAVLISLFTDRQADPDDIIPDGTADRRGWWADPAMGSKLWLRIRLKATELTRALVKGDIEQALAWLVEDDVAAAVDVAVEWTKSNMLAARVVIRRADGSRMAMSFSRAWETI